MASLVNILLLSSDHSLYRKHMRKVYPTLHKYYSIAIFKSSWRDFAPIKISLAVLYSIVWIWDLTGNIFKHLHLDSQFHDTPLIF